MEFEGVRQVAEVYLNGHRVGTCKNGFVPFGFDLTPYVDFNANGLYLDLECGINRVAVRSTLLPGKITVTAQCAGLKSASVEIPSRPMREASSW